MQHLTASSVRCSNVAVFKPAAAPVLPGRNTVRARVGGQGPAMTPEMQAAMQKAMQDPQMMKAMQSMMQSPAFQKQMQEMQAMMQNQALQQRLQQLKDDPEFKEMFDDIRQNGMGAMMKYYNDPKWLAKLGNKLDDVVPAGAATAATAAPAAAAAPPMPEITNLLDAAKYGDEEAVEDFIAIGKDVNIGDKEGRTPLHYAAAYERVSITKQLLEAGAKTTNVDSMQNTPLHYACGYGRAETTALLLEAGSDIKAKNNTGKTPVDLVKMDARNPLNSLPDLMAKLSA